MKRWFLFAVPALILLYFTLSGAAESSASVQDKQIKPIHAEQIVKSHVLLGLTHLKMDDFMAAVGEFEKALEIDPHFTFKREQVVDFYCELGMIYVLNSDLRGSLKFFRRSLSLDPDYSRAKDALAGALGMIAEEYAIKSQADSARVYFTQALEINPGLDLTEVLQVFKEPMLKIQGLEEVNVDLAMVYCAIARQYAQVGQNDVAQGYYELAIKLRPGFPSAVKGLEKIVNVNQAD